MSEFRLYLDLGVFHILDFAGYDHMLFVMAIATIYLINDWRKVLVLVTAFTIGHSITLALATLELIKYDLELIEFLIPLTISITALANLFTRDRRRFEVTQRKGYINYFFAGFFGTIHGLGFSSYLKVLLGAEQNIIKPLFAFNIGLEIGQMVIMILFLMLSTVFVDFFGVDRRDWKLIISSIILGISVTLILGTDYMFK
ncbi:MAG: HupE/UreJ family protein [Cyclobacteriaceae bacterium]|jgi:hypothetical protein|nr:HupE/UreJ family protein [Cyclobacteriaceae bacterium]